MPTRLNVAPPCRLVENPEIHAVTSHARREIALGFDEGFKSVKITGYADLR